MASKKALVVGINEYPPPNRLPSCVRDATTFKQILESQYGFKVDSLFDEEATKAAFESKIKKMFVGAKPADRFVLYYSGHGYQAPVNGVLEEFLVLIDGFYHDDDLSLLTQVLPPGVLTVVLDSCFSGGMDKPYFIVSQTDQGVERAKSKFWTPTKDDEVPREGADKDFSNITAYKPFGCAPVDLAKLPGEVDNKLFLAQNLLGESDLKAGLMASGALGAVGAAAKGAARPSASWAFSRAVAQALSKDVDDEAGQLQMTGLLVAACSENETAAASNGLTNGLSAFTFCLQREILAGNGGKSTAALIEAVTARLGSLGFRQTPVVKPPLKPLGLENLPFITLSAASGGDGGNGAPDEDSLQDLIARIIGIVRKMGAQSSAPAGASKSFQSRLDARDGAGPSLLVANLVRALANEHAAPAGPKELDLSTLAPAIARAIQLLS